jgi:hypothetical protein
LLFSLLLVYYLVIIVTPYRIDHSKGACKVVLLDVRFDVADVRISKAVLQGTQTQTQIQDAPLAVPRRSYSY